MSTVVSSAPTVINTVTTVTPSAVVQLFQLLGTMGAVWLTSIIHQLVDKNSRISPNLNRLIVTLYASGAAVGYDLLTGNLHFTATGFLNTLIAFVVALGTALGRYELSKALNPTPSTTSLPVVEQA